MNIAIKMATYRRKDGKTPFYLRRALDSIFAQTYTDFKIYLVGDCYDDEVEWTSVITPYLCDRLYCVNLASAVERIKYQDKTVLWSCGGVNAVNIASDKALEEGFSYICHIDHDDYWKSNHLEVLNTVIENTRAVWLCTKSVYGGRIFPENDKPEYIIPFRPLPGGVIHSSVCYDRRIIPLRVRDTYAECGTAIPADADLWDRMNKYISENNLSSYLVNELTCFHEEEGYVLYGKR